MIIERQLQGSYGTFFRAFICIYIYILEYVYNVIHMTEGLGSSDKEDILSDVSQILDV